ncbi:MAG TPA: heavy-metal-associated domain-containing protein [Trueperaceae bacterium]|nr:heavy-metal-associated domain-containing protein [Trueperaceae bacterium]
MADQSGARVLLGVRGMDTATSRGRVEEALRSVRGVLRAEASSDRQVAVEYDAAEVTVMDLIRALRRIGFLAGME